MLPFTCISRSLYMHGFVGLVTCISRICRPCYMHQVEVSASNLSNKHPRPLPPKSVTPHPINNNSPRYA